MKHRAVRALICLILLLSTHAALADRTPLLMEGKKTLYQRVLTEPDAKLFPQPGAAAGTSVPAMSIYYVYTRQEGSGGPWLEVGPGSDGKTAGWVPAKSTIDWKQQIVLTFTNPSNRDPALMFDTAEHLEQVVSAQSPADAASALRKTIAAGNVPSDFPVIATEPDKYIDFTKNFYLLPILSAHDTMTEAGFNTTELELASLPAAAVDTKPAAPSDADMLQNFTAGVVFVVDSTKSMGPYIDRTRKAVEKLYDEISGKAVGNKVSFGLVAFRAGDPATKGIDYVSKVFVDPNKVTDKASFLASIKNLSAADVSTPRFDEDSLGGVMSALKEIDWAHFGARYVVLITDAGPLEGSDPYSTTKMNADQVRVFAKDQQVAIYTLHLLTPEGAADHDAAKTQYDVLSTNASVMRPLYYSIPNGDVDALGQTVEQLAEAVVQQISDASLGKSAVGAVAPTSAPKRDIAEDTAAVGYAMRLAYLGRTAKTAAPKLVESWMIDRDFAKPTVPTVDVRVLLTKAQLSDLQQTLKGVLEAAHQKQFDPAGFYGAVKSVAAALGRDPAKLQDPKATSLSQMGLLGEYVEGLPYKSAVLNIDQDTWQSWPIAQQNYFQDELERKLALYQQYNDDTTRWVALYPNAPASELVYPVPLDALP
jgi:serine/threonine-protein kinase PpkA